MPRKGPAPRRDLLPDPVYRSTLVTQLINKVMLRGKKSVAERNVYKAFDIIREKTDNDPLSVYKRALENTKPQLQVKSRRVGGATYQVPMEVPEDRSIALCIRWILTFARARKGAPMATRLATEFMEASKKEGNAMKKREDTHKMAEANKAFAHYKW